MVHPFRHPHSVAALTLVMTPATASFRSDARPKMLEVRLTARPHWL